MMITFGLGHTSFSSYVPLETEHEDVGSAELLLDVIGHFEADLEGETLGHRLRIAVERVSQTIGGRVVIAALNLVKLMIKLAHFLTLICGFVTWKFGLGQPCLRFGQPTASLCPSLGTKMTMST